MICGNCHNEVPAKESHCYVSNNGIIWTCRRSLFADPSLPLRCDTCEYWVEYPLGPHPQGTSAAQGLSRILNNKGTCTGEQLKGVTVPRNFGCVQWKEKV